MKQAALYDFALLFEALINMSRKQKLSLFLAKVIDFNYNVTKILSDFGSDLCTFLAPLCHAASRSFCHSDQDLAPRQSAF